jgi:signal transduction histidine kinase
VATSADYLLNVALVTIFGSLSFGLRPAEVLGKLKVGRLSEFVVSYLGLGLVGLVLAQVYKGVGFWAVAAFITPVIFARQLFFRGLALEEAHTALRAREQVLEALSNRMAEERQDERAQIAAYLHDDLAQMLFRLSLQVDIAKRHLRNATPEEVEADLENIRETKNRTNDLIRALIRDLHRSPLGRAGVGEALKSFTEDVGGGSGVAFVIEVEDLPLPPPIALLIYHISREAVMNSMKHAQAETIRIALESVEDSVELTISDDGVGFDAEGPGPEGHFGMTMMRERAQVAGGTYTIQSAAGQGTTITVRFPTSWLDEEAAQPPPADADEPPPSLTEPPNTRDVKRELTPPMPPGAPAESGVRA